MLNHLTIAQSLNVDVLAHMNKLYGDAASKQYSFSLYKRGTYFDLYCSEHNATPVLARVEARSDDSSALGVAKEHALLAQLSADIRPEIHYVSSDSGSLGFRYRVESFYSHKTDAIDEVSFLTEAAILLSKLHTTSVDTSNIALSCDAGGGLLHLLEIDYPIHSEITELRAFAREIALHLSNTRNRQCLVHGDVHYDNFLRTKDKVLLIDWEHASIDDPALDVAELFCFPYLMKQRDGILPDNLQAIFLEKYVSLTGDESIGRRAQFYMALVMVLHLISWDLKASQGQKHDADETEEFSDLVKEYARPVTRFVDALRKEV